MAPVNSASVIQTHPPAKLADTKGISLTSSRCECVDHAFSYALTGQARSNMQVRIDLDSTE